MSPWPVDTWTGSAHDLHHRDPGPAFGARVWVLQVDRPALVLGSTQPEADVDLGRAEQRGVEVARRRSGGGAVLLTPGDVAWLDVLVPADHPRWDPDVARASHWVGAAWASAWATLGGADQVPVVHRGGMEGRELGRVVCFAGLGPGEVTVRSGEWLAKAVGISQRRTRAGARFQTMAVRRWRGELLAELVAPGLRRVGVDPSVVVDLPVAPAPAPVEAVVDAVVAALGPALDPAARP